MAMHRTPEMHRTPRVPGVGGPPKLSVAATYAAAAGQHYPRHQHSTWELIYYRSGHISCALESRAVETRPGMVLVIPPRTLHHDLAHTAYSQVYVRLERHAPFGVWPHITYDDSERTLSYLFGALAREWPAPPSPEQGELLGLLVRQLDLTLCRKAHEPPEHSAEWLVREAERLFEARLTDAQTVKGLATELAISSSTLRAHFARLRGYSPINYLQRLRLERALELVRSSSLNLDEIAGLCGYYSASHLSRSVKKATGHPPGRFRLPRSD